uniref:DUF6451 domain-containing protein n=1 Tax=Schistosoma curassoni TaxID=6186 RepID=A0A183KCE0_9TREM
LEDVKTFTYLGSIIDQHGGSDADVKARICKARAAYLQLKNIWDSKQLTTNTKFRIFNINVTDNTNPISLGGESVEDVESSLCLVGIIDERRGFDADLNARIDKPMVTPLQLKNIWNSKQLCQPISK